MGHHDEYEMLIQYSEMTTFDFNSEEFQKVRKDYIDCKNAISNFAENFKSLFKRFRPNRIY
jgi:hypothetical protein